MIRAFKRASGVLVVLAFILVGCNDSGIIELTSSVEQLELDLLEIKEYIQEKGYSNVDTTESRVRFVILEEGTGETIEPNDIVSFDYAGMLLNDTLFDTSRESIAIEGGLYDSARIYTPYVFTHTESGWALETLGFVQGFSDGTTAAMKKMNVGGRARLMIPSGLGYGSSAISSIPSNSVLVFDIYPVKVRK